MTKGVTDRPLLRILQTLAQKKPSAVQDSSSLVNKRFLSDTHGRIRHILVSSFFSSSPAAIRFYKGKENLMKLFLSHDYRRIKSLVENTDPDVRVTVIHQGGYLLNEANPNLSQLRQKFGGRVNIESTDFQPMLWVQDRLQVFEGRTVLIRASDPATDEHFREEGLPAFRFGVEHLPVLGFECLMSPSGTFNIMREADLYTSDEFVFLGPKTVMDTYQIRKSGRNFVRGEKLCVEIAGPVRENVDSFARTGQLWGELKRHAESLAHDLKLLSGGKEVVVPFSPGSPAYKGDLDMVMTPLGGKLVSVANTSLAEGVAKRLSSEGFDFVKPGTGEDSLRDYRFEQEELESVARALSQRGLTVVRVPLLNRMERNGEVIPWCSYNNVLVEIFGNKKRVYMPVYGIDDLDEAAAQVYAGLGFEVRKIKGLSEAAKHLGALRCSIKILERSR